MKTLEEERGESKQEKETEEESEPDREKEKTMKTRDRERGNLTCTFLLQVGLRKPFFLISPSVENFKGGNEFQEKGNTTPLLAFEFSLVH